MILCSKCERPRLENKPYCVYCNSEDFKDIPIGWENVKTSVWDQVDNSIYSNSKNTVI